MIFYRGNVMNRNIFLIILMVLVISFLLTGAKDKDPDKKKNDGQNKEDRTKQKNQKESSVLLHANENFIATEILGRPTDKSVTINIVPSKEMFVYCEFGTGSGNLKNRTPEIHTAADTPLEIPLEKLNANTRYYYRILYKIDNKDAYTQGNEFSFMTQRTPGSSFSFGIQGDSHPERINQFDPELYKITMTNVKKNAPDFYMTIGDDFSVDTLSEITNDAVTRIYANQRYYLGIPGSSAPVFLVNGNHEQAAKYVLNGTAENNAVWAQNSRNLYYPQPAPDEFYTGDDEKVDFIGYLRDYYAWTWGDALFIVIDPYWHTPVAVDNALKSDEKRADLWDITLGDRQYQWLKKTLEQSKSKYKFVFTHHVIGTGRGGIDEADQYEWGGRNKKGQWEFDKKRPGWELPVHQLMAKNKVTIFFQGHDHIFVKQELDGVIYLELPEPADPNYALYNDDAYKSDVKYPNSGYVKVSISKENLKVDYIRSFLPKDEIEGHKNGEVAYSFTVLPR
jgi:hypothetical protein